MIYLKNIKAIGLIWGLSNVSFSVLGQNLLINPSFEVFEHCPDTYSSKSTSHLIEGWASPNDGTPDYFNVCSSDSAGIPDNWTGYCEPKHGNAYMGFYLFKKAQYREFIQGSFLRPLTIGERYRLTFYVSHALNAEYQIDKIGCLFVSQPIFSTILSSNDEWSLQQTQNHKSSTSSMNLNKDRGQFLDVSLTVADQGWYQVDIEFTANLPAQHLIVGSFDRSEDIQWEKNKFRMEEEPMLDVSSYVLADDFSLVQVGGLQKENTLHASAKFIVNDLNFEFAEAKLQRTGLRLLDSLYHQYLALDSSKMLISGHTDDLGDDFFNDELSRRRATSVAQYLVKIGMDSSRIEIIGHGETQPLRPNDSEENRRYNRRVEIECLE